MAQQVKTEQSTAEIVRVCARVRAALAQRRVARANSRSRAQELARSLALDFSSNIDDGKVRRDAAARAHARTHAHSTDTCVAGASAALWRRFLRPEEPRQQLLHELCAAGALPSAAVHRALSELLHRPRADVHRGPWAVPRVPAGQACSRSRHGHVCACAARHAGGRRRVQQAGGSRTRVRARARCCRRVCGATHAHALSAQETSVAPRMFKQLIAHNHREFASTRQQDALEFLQYFVEQLERHEKRQAVLNADKRDPTRALQFELEQRMECATCHGALRRARMWVAPARARAPVSALTDGARRGCVCGRLSIPDAAGTRAHAAGSCCARDRVCGSAGCPADACCVSRCGRCARGSAPGARPDCAAERVLAGLWRGRERHAVVPVVRQQLVSQVRMRCVRSCAPVLRIAQDDARRALPSAPCGCLVALCRRGNDVQEARCARPFSRDALRVAALTCPASEAVVPPAEDLDLAELAGHGPQPSETILPNASGACVSRRGACSNADSVARARAHRPAAASSLPPVDQAALAQLMEMVRLSRACERLGFTGLLRDAATQGFPKRKCERALRATKNDPQAGTQWLFEHMDDPDGMLAARRAQRLSARSVSRARRGRCGR